MGTEGEIWGDFHDKKLCCQRFNEPLQTIDLGALCDDFTGHGGDARLIYDVIRLYRGADFDTSAITFLDRSAQNHYLAFAAEKFRVEGGRLKQYDERACCITDATRPSFFVCAYSWGLSQAFIYSQRSRHCSKCWVLPDRAKYTPPSEFTLSFTKSIQEISTAIGHRSSSSVPSYWA